MLASLGWCRPLISAFGRQRQRGLCEFKASLSSKVSSRKGSKATEKACLKGKKVPIISILQIRKKMQ